MAATQQQQTTTYVTYPDDGHRNYQTLQVQAGPTEFYPFQQEENRGGIGFVLGMFLSIFGLLGLIWIENPHGRRTFIRGWAVGCFVVPFVIASILGIIFLILYELFKNV